MVDPDLDEHEWSFPAVEVVPGGPVNGSIRPPGSKSLTNRALICAAFARGRSLLRGALRSEDTEVMIAALGAIGVTIEVSDGGRTLAIDGTTRVTGRRGEAQRLDLFIANSGTSIRFLTAALSAAGGCYRLHGVERMHRRPIGDLVSAIGPILHGHIEAVSEGQCPPVQIDSAGWGAVDIDVAGSVSSQYLSGLMMAAPIAASSSGPAAANRATAIRIVVSGELVSRPYVDMTAQVMRCFGADVRLSHEALKPGQTVAVTIGPTAYQPIDYAIEPDASAASYFWAAAAISGGRVTVEGLSRDSTQGDVGFCEVLAKMGCGVHFEQDRVTVTAGPLRGVDVDMNAISDTVQTLAVVALFAEGPTRIRGVAHNRFKETDRIGDLARELRKLGAVVEEHQDGLTIRPPAEKSELHGATLRTYRDHRMAMSLALAGLVVPGVRILDPGCTSKTYPEFFADLEQLSGRSHRWSRDTRA
jgi:3-phosphoshikimate 1-carboxyvinyltransferase